MRNDKLIRASAAIARSAPQHWRMFMDAFAEHVNTCRDDVVSSPVDTLQVAQGRAKEGTDLLRLFNGCLATAEKMENKT